jgi:hypothetical protein
VPAKGESAMADVPPQPVFGGDVSAALRLRQENKAGAAVKVFHGTADPVESKF